MDGAFYNLTDVLTIIKVDGTIEEPKKTDVTSQESLVDNSKAPDENRRIITKGHALALSEDGIIERDFMEDGGTLFENISRDIRIRHIKRYQKIVKEAKKRCNYCCQICGDTFTKDNGEKYCEAHHITPLSKNGSQNPVNIIIVCANHHRMFHYATTKITIDSVINGQRRICINGECHIISYR